MTHPDAELISQAVEGDSLALSKLLHEHGAQIEQTLQIGTIWQAVLDPADVMQVTYLEAFMRISTFDSTRAESFQAWLRRIAENNLKDAIRGFERQKQPQPRDRIKPGRYEDSLVGLYNMLATTSATPSLKVRQKEIGTALESAINALPERYAKVIRLYDLEGQSIAEVAKAMDKSAGAVHMMRARAHDRLRELLGSASNIFGSQA